MSKRKYGRAEREMILSDLKEWANRPENIDADLKGVDYQKWAKQLPNTGTSLLNKTGRVSLLPSQDVLVHGKRLFLK